MLKLYHGDALEVLSELSGGFDCCITDPPYSAAFIGHFYNVLKRYQNGANLKKSRDYNAWNWTGIPGYWSDMYYKSNEEYESFTFDWMKLVFPLMLPGGFLEGMVFIALQSRQVIKFIIL